ncbi:MAG: helix-turn-helix domain-containing protein [Geminicoccaceae bacterium]
MASSPSSIKTTRECSLQRYLHAQEISFSSLLDIVRYEIARSLLRDPSPSLAEITTRLGYRNTSSFCRAFMRWSGKTPRHWRTSKRACK